jgi:hypothetical protein
MHLSMLPRVCRCWIDVDILRRTDTASSGHVRVVYSRVTGPKLGERVATCDIAMAAQQKRARGDDVADESTGSRAGVGSTSTSQTSPSQPFHVLNGEPVSLSFVYTTMWKSPATLYLLANTKVSFQSASDVPACSAHGTWSASPDLKTLRVWFHCAADWAKIREHVFRRIEDTQSYELEVRNAEYKAFLHQRTQTRAE